MRSITPWRRLRNFSSGSSRVSTKEDGRERAEPYTISAAEVPESSMGFARRPSMTQGRSFTQVEAASRALNAAFKRRWNRSTIPFDCGWYGVVKICSIPSSLQKLDQRVLVNWVPWSVVIVDGAPKHTIQAVTKALRQVSAEMLDRGIASGQWVVRSMMVSR